MQALSSSHAFFKAQALAGGVAQSSRRHLSHLRLLLVIAFRYALMLHADITQTVSTMEVLSWSEPLLDAILEQIRDVVVKGNTREGGYAIKVEFLHEMLFYKFKSLFVSAELAARGSGNDEQRALQLYERAMEVWWERHGYDSVLQEHRQHHRSDEEEHVDPCLEAFETLYRLTVMSCSELSLSAPVVTRESPVGHWRAQLLGGLGNVTRSLSLHEEVWGHTDDVEGGQRLQGVVAVPDQVLVMLGKTLVAGGDCHRLLDECSQAEGRYKEAHEVLNRLVLPAFQEKMTPLLGYVNSSISYVSVGRCGIADGGGGEGADGDDEARSSTARAKQSHSSSSSSLSREEEHPLDGEMSNKRVFRRRKKVEL